MIPVYELTLYQPRTVDAAEATVRTPAANAPHADPFVLTSIQGLAGAKPYLEPPRGRRGALSVRDRKVDTGELTLRIMDARTGTDNLARWLTGFLGDAAGNYGLLGLKARVRESLDGGATWGSPSYFTGRVYDVRGGRLWVELVLRDRAEELSCQIFRTSPHSSITYACRPRLLPLGLPQAYGPVPATPKARGTVKTVYYNQVGVGRTGVGWMRQVTLDRTRTPKELRVNTALYDAHYTTLSKGLSADSHYFEQIGDGYCSAKRLDTGATGWFTVQHGLYGYEFLKGDRDGAVCVTDISIGLLPTTHPRYMAFPPDGTVLEFEILPTLPTSEDCPLVVSDVHIVQWMADVCDGKFGLLKVDGSPARVFPRANAAGWAAGDPWSPLIADTTFPTVRDLLTEPQELREWLEHRCLEAGLAYAINGDGAIELRDIRRRSALTIASTLTDADLVATQGAATWEQPRKDAITAVDATYYLDKLLDQPDIRAHAAERAPAIPHTLISPQDVPFKVRDLSERTIDIQDKPLTIDAETFRTGVKEQLGGEDRQAAVERQLQAAIDDLKAPFGGGAQYATLRCTRTSANAKAARPGTWHLLDCDSLPDPATNRRGGARLGLCVEVAEDGPAVEITFLDAGPNSVCVAPAIGAWARDAADTRSQINVPLTLNAAGDPCEFWYAVTPTTVNARPADSDPAWRKALTATASGTYRVVVHAAGQRVWGRARSVPATDRAGRKLPSGWTYAPDYKPMDAQPAPTALAAGGITKTTATLTWTPATDGGLVYVYLTTGAAPAAWDDAQIVQRLPAGSATLMLHRLDGPTVQHTAGVQHVDPATGDRSAIVTVTFTTGTVPATAPRPAGIDLARV